MAEAYFKSGYPIEGALISGELGYVDDEGAWLL